MVDISLVLVNYWPLPILIIVCDHYLQEKEVKVSPTTLDNPKADKTGRSKDIISLGKKTIYSCLSNIFLPFWDSELFFFPRSCHVDQFTFHISLTYLLYNFLSYIAPFTFAIFFCFIFFLAAIKSWTYGSSDLINGLRRLGIEQKN